MSRVCANGHTSEADDYCDVCGLKLEEPSGPPSEPSADPALPDAAADPMPTSTPAATAPGTKTCPNCGEETDVDGEFCENCGFNFVTGEGLDEPAANANTTATWEAVVTADRAYFDRFDAGDVEFPAGYGERRFPLAGPEVHIGRRSVSKGITPDIDLSDAPADAGVSHVHAVLRQNADGWSVTDRESVNGTFVNDGQEPVPPDQPVDLVAGDRIHVGAWTTITLRKIAS